MGGGERGVLLAYGYGAFKGGGVEVVDVDDGAVGLAGEDVGWGDG